MVGEMTQQARVFAVKPDSLSSIPGSHTWKRTDSHKFTSDLHRCTVAHTSAFPHK